MFNNVNLCVYHLPCASTVLCFSFTFRHFAENRGDSGLTMRITAVSEGRKLCPSSNRLFTQFRSEGDPYNALQAARD